VALRVGVGVGIAVGVGVGVSVGVVVDVGVGVGVGSDAGDEGVADGDGESSGEFDEELSGPAVERAAAASTTCQPITRTATDAKTLPSAARVFTGRTVRRANPAFGVCVASRVPSGPPYRIRPCLSLQPSAPH
jgi:hypothetical protein